MHMQKQKHRDYTLNLHTHVCARMKRDWTIELNDLNQVLLYCIDQNILISIYTFFLSNILFECIFALNSNFFLSLSLFLLFLFYFICCATT